MAWDPCYRVIPTTFAENLILGKLADAEDLEAVSAVEEMTNERLRQERGEAALVPVNDVVTGGGAKFIMAQFTYRNPEGNRFSDGTHGVYYAARDRETAVEETKHHREIFMRRTSEPPMRLEMRVVTAKLEGQLHDLRGMQKSLKRVYSPTSYSASQELARDLVKSASSGIVYDSVRRKGGECAAVFRPPVISRAKAGEQMIFDWDGKSIVKVYELKEMR